MNTSSDFESTMAMPLTDFEADRLQRQFLDRLAETVANEKGGRHVVATMMRVSLEGTHIIAARNSKFRTQDESFLKCLQSLLRSIASGSREFPLHAFRGIGALTPSAAKAKTALVSSGQLC